MSIQAPTSDAQLLDLLRVAGPLSILELAHAMEVTATAVRQRVVRLLRQKAIQRKVSRYGRGRPRHLYELTEKGLRQIDSPFTEVALTVWEEIRQSSDPELRRDTLRRIARAWLSGDADRIQGKTPAQRKKSLVKLLKERQIPVSVEKGGRRRITLEQTKVVSQMIKAIGGFGRLYEMLSIIRQVGGVTRLKDWLDTMEVDKSDDGM